MVWLHWFNASHKAAIRLLARVAVTHEGSTGGDGIHFKFNHMVLAASVPSKIGISIKLSLDTASLGEDGSSESV